MSTRHRATGAFALAALLLAFPGLALANEDPTSPAPAVSSSPEQETAAPEVATDPQNPAEPTPPADLGADPQELPAPEPGKKEAEQSDAELAAEKLKAQEKARAAVDDARAAYQKALAKHRLAKYEVEELLKQSRTAEKRAANLLRDMGNLARMAYSTGDSGLNLMARLIDSPAPQDVLAGASAVERVSAHKEVQWIDATTMQNKADDLAAQARAVSDRAAERLTDAKAELDRAMELAEAVDLSIEPLEKVPPVDLSVESDWVFPTATGQIDSEAGMRMHPILRYQRCHEGADISVPSGTAIYAVDDGVVITAGVNGGYGNYTQIAHGDGLTSAYAHQQTMFVKPGDRVTKGQLIGEVGTTGLSTGPHLHFEARYHGTPYNPRGWLEEDRALRAPAC